jgi:hypothetical protein
VTRAGAALLAFAACLAGPARATQTDFDFLYVHANQGGSSGGHAAIRFGDAVYHFQREDGLLRLRRDEWRHFQHRYRTLENRPIELMRAAVEPGTFERLRRGFARRQLAQDRQLALAAALRADVELLEALRASRVGNLAAAQGFPVEGAGFFAAAPGAGSRAVAALRERIEAERPGLLAARRRALEAEIAALPLEPFDVDAVELAPARLPVSIDTFASRYAQLGSALAALDALERDSALRPERIAPAAGPALALDPAALARLREAQAALAAALVRLVATPRPDWGHPLLLGMARLAALERSLEARELLLLDVLPADAERLPLDAARRAWLPALLAEAADEFAAARQEFLAGRGFEEASWSALEEAGGRWLELRAAAAGASALRVAAGRLVPAAFAPAALPMPAAAQGPIEERLAAARASERRFRARLEEQLGYDLVRRNCVSEIFRAIAEELDDGPRSASTRRFGGWIPPGEFVPFLAARRVRERWAVVEDARLPSYREHRLAEMFAREPDLLVALRESNALTARAYRRNDRDGFFLFFTDDRPVLRPLLGALNLAAGLGRGGVGLLALPLDGGRGLRAGLRGVLWSLPELFFASVRKGTHEYVPRAERPPPA